jgi:hypothetical protein
MPRYARRARTELGALLRLAHVPPKQTVAFNKMIKRRERIGVPLEIPDMSDLSCDTIINLKLDIVDNMNDDRVIVWGGFEVKNCMRRSV